MGPDRLIVFDYSGTLSLAAPRFARPDNLVRTLAETGLAAWGVATPEVFWGEIVEPTWVAGSTTRAGYGKVMAERIAALRRTPAAELGRIGEAAARFVAAYLERSPVDPLWRPVLHRLAGERSSLQVVATDHYAEATAAIVGHLETLGIEASAVSGPGAGFAPRQGTPDRRSAAGGDCRFFIANSADLGVWKSDRRFWEIVKAQLPGPPHRGLLVLDDFGLNEEVGDTYSLLPKATVRQEETLAVLREVFGAPVHLFPFVLPEGQRESDAAGRRLIAAAATRIERFPG